jgi:HprK-related kinase A
LLIGQLDREELALRLRDGVDLDTGAFTSRLRFTLSGLVDDFARMYASYAIGDAPGIVDARVRVVARHPWRAPLRPLAQAWVNGEPLTASVPVERAYVVLETSFNFSVVVGGLAPLILHAAVLERDGRALVLPAPSGSGKSTLAAALAWRGWRLFSDETAVFGLDDGLVYPNPRPVSLKNAAIDLIARIEPRARMSRTFAGTAKGDVAYMIPPAEAVARAHEPAAPALVVSPAYVAAARPHARRLEAIDGFRMLMDNAVNYASFLRTGFDLLANVVERSRVHEITYSSLDDAIGLIDELDRAAAR